MRVPWKPIAILTTITTILLLLLLLPAYCFVKEPLVPVGGPSQVVIPLIGTEPIPTPSEAAAKAPTQALMRNVWFHFDRDAYLDVHSMRGEMVSKTAGAPLNLDNKLSFVMRVDTAKIGMRSASLDVLMNRYIFGYANPPLRNVHVELSGKQLKQSGIIHKIIDMRFTMLADVSASNGLIRIPSDKDPHLRDQRDRPAEGGGDDVGENAADAQRAWDLGAGKRSAARSATRAPAAAGGSAACRRPHRRR